ncbi:hypothetical protein AAFF_G00097800 [Aldrovandia affinis]|uniref:Reverse transcriptase domain-containing protein n=1 Tax=Aldrovandia affinis TaxID=143900 RepID=A0AAD7WBH6_9TELE|nr:hypothetical protein AAFF_G00097800 [Aldrovandia affinis]
MWSCSRKVSSLKPKSWTWLKNGSLRVIVPLLIDPINEMAWDTEGLPWPSLTVQFDPIDDVLTQHKRSPKAEATMSGPIEGAFMIKGALPKTGVFIKITGLLQEAGGEPTGVRRNKKMAIQWPSKESRSPGNAKKIGEQWSRSLDRVGVYVDDLIIWGATWEEHDTRLEKTLQRIQWLMERWERGYRS